LEFVYPGVYPWSEARLAVAAISGDGSSTTITMAQPAFDHARSLYDSKWYGAGGEGTWDGLAAPSVLENNVAFLSEPGTFAVDRSEPGRHILHYRPRPGEEIGKTTAVVPVLETLVSGQGVHGIVLRGLTFAEANWSGPPAPAATCIITATPTTSRAGFRRSTSVSLQSARCALVPASGAFRGSADGPLLDGGGWRGADRRHEPPSRCAGLLDHLWAGARGEADAAVARLAEAMALDPEQGALDLPSMRRRCVRCGSLR
jgi:hypothetical protein